MVMIVGLVVAATMVIMMIATMIMIVVSGEKDQWKFSVEKPEVLRRERWGQFLAGSDARLQARWFKVSQARRFAGGPRGDLVELSHARR